MRAKKIAFILLDDIHHVYHTAPIAFALSFYTEYKVTLYYSTRSNEDLIKEMALLYEGHCCHLKFIRPSWFFWLREKIRNRSCPSASKVLKHNFAKIMQHDLVVGGDLSLLWLIKRKKDKTTKFAFSFHGSGDSAYPFNQRLDMFDFFLVSGEKYKDRLLASSAIDAERIKVMGYPKFDITLAQAIVKPVFNNGNKTILYNPHFLPEVSSWQQWGAEILEWFLSNPEYNLIFAPHIMLYRDESVQKIVPKKFFAAPNIHIADPKDKRCVDMSLIKEADVYIGDASSQVYEFLYKKRPCFFLNPQQNDWEESKIHLHWKTGLVINKLPTLFKSLPNAEGIHQHFIVEQKKLFDYTFLSGEESASIRAAKKLHVFVSKQNDSTQLKILFTNEHYGGGHDSYISGLAHGLKERGQEVYVAVPESSRLKELIARSNQVHFVAQNYPTKIKQIGVIFKEAKKLRILLKQIQFDIVQTSGSADHRLMIYASLFLPNKPKIIFTQHNLKKVRGSTKSSLNKHCDQVIAVSNAAKESLVSKGIQTPIEVIHSGVDVAYFSCPQENLRHREELGILKDDIVLVSNAGCEELKGWHFLTQAVATLPVELKNKIKIILIGNKPFEHLYQRYVADIKMDDQVFFVGFQSNVRPYICLANIGFVLSIESGGLSLACREMMALGKPVLVSDYGGLPENVTDGKDGWICQAKNIINIQEKLKEILANVNTIPDKGEQARQKSVHAFSLDSFVTKVLDLYLKI